MLVHGNAGMFRVRNTFAGIRDCIAFLTSVAERRTFLSRDNFIIGRNWGSESRSREMERGCLLIISVFY